MRLVIFDVDGTLVDSQGDIVASMTAAFVSEALAVPTRDEILGIVGLSLDHAMLKLSPDSEAAARDRMVAAYKDAYHDLRVKAGAASSPLYPGIAEAVAQLIAHEDTVLAIATGKSRRGLLALLDNHGWTDVFASLQVADDHPSKPHPSMVLAALAETGIGADRAVMVGDTTFDMDMAGAAGVPFLGVDWGYHPSHLLTGAAEVVSAADQIPAATNRIIGELA